MKYDIRTSLPTECYLCRKERILHYWHDIPLCEKCLRTVKKSHNNIQDKIRIKLQQHKYYLRRKFKK